MPEANEVEQQPEVAEQPESEVKETQEVVEETAEETPTEEQPEEGTAEVEAEAETPPEPKKYKLKINGQEEEWDEAKVIEFAQKGADYGRKMQSISEWEKGKQQQLQLAEQIMADPIAVKSMIARQLGYDPNMVMGNIQPPDPSWKEMYPEQYGRQVAIYELAQQQKQVFENAVQGIITANAQSANTAAFEKARITHELNDAEFAQVRQFVNENMRPNQAGMYSEAQIQAAVRATVDRSATEKLNTANRVQQNLKKAANSAPKKPANQRQEKVSDEVLEARRFKEVAQSLSRYKPKQA